MVLPTITKTPLRDEKRFAFWSLPTKWKHIKFVDRQDIILKTAVNGRDTCQLWKIAKIVLRRLLLPSYWLFLGTVSAEIVLPNLFSAIHLSSNKNCQITDSLYTYETVWVTNDPSVTYIDTKIRWRFGVKLGLPSRPGTQLGFSVTQCVVCLVSAFVSWFNSTESRIGGIYTWSRLLGRWDYHSANEHWIIRTNHGFLLQNDRWWTRPIQNFILMASSIFRTDNLILLTPKQHQHCLLYTVQFFFACTNFTTVANNIIPAT